MWAVERGMPLRSSLIRHGIPSARPAFARGIDPFLPYPLEVLTFAHTVSANGHCFSVLERTDDAP